MEVSHILFIDKLASVLDVEWNNIRILYAEPWEIQFVVPAGERNNYEIHYLEKGSGVFTVGSREYPITAGDVVCLYSMEGNSFTSDEEFRFMFITFEIQNPSNPERIEELNASMRDGKHIKLPNPDSIQSLLHQLYRETSIKNKGYLFCSKLLLGNIVACIRNHGLGSDAREIRFPANNKTQQLVNRVIIYLQENYMTNISLKDLGNLVNLHPRYLCTIFHQVNGQTINEFLRVIRLEKAKRLLLNTSLDITEIAMQVGFNSSQYFSRVFKDIEGLDPRTFRKSKSRGV